MKILFLSDFFPPNHLGGAAIVAFRLARELKKRGHDLYIITTVRDKSLEGFKDVEELKVYQIYSKFHPRWRAYFSLYNWSTSSKIKAIIKEIKPDIIHAHNIHYYISYYSIRLANKYCKKFFLTAHDTMLVNYDKWQVPENNENLKISNFSLIKEAKKRYNPFRNIIIRYFLKKVNKIFAISYSLKKFLESNGLKNIEVIYNGINPEEWQYNSKSVEEFKKKYHLLNKKTILFAGRLSEFKGGEIIIQTMKQVNKKIPQATLLVVGAKDGYGQKMLELAKEAGIENKIVFTDWLTKEEIKTAYFSSDLVVTPSIYFDPFNLINIEAMAAKRPVIGTSFGGTKEIVLDNQTGYIVNPNNIKNMEEKIIDLLNNADKAKKFGENGFKRVNRFFNIKEQTNKTLKYYQNNSY